LPKIFISYRRSDTTAGYASWIYDRLTEAFGEENVFMDIDSLPLGVDFVDQLEATLHQSDVALVLIGPNWLTATFESGARRLDDPEDFVRLEVGRLLRTDVRVIPVLVDGAKMPAGNELPGELSPLARRQGLVFNRHGGGAIRDLTKAIREADAERARTAIRSPAPPREPPPPPPEAPPREPAAPGPEPPVDPADEPPPERRSHRRLILAAAAAVIVAAIIGVVVATGGGGSASHTSSFRALSKGAIPVGNSPDGMVIAHGNVWVANAGDGTMTRIDQASGHVLGTSRYTTRPVTAAPLSMWNQALWVGDAGNGTVDEIDPASPDAIKSRVTVGGQPYALNVAAGALWIANSNDTLARLVTGSTTPSTIHVGAGPKRMAFTSTRLWVDNRSAGTVTRIDATTGQVLGTTTIGGNPTAINVLSGTLWVADETQNTVTRRDLVSVRAVGSPIHVGAGPRRVAVDNGSMWFANARDGTVTRIDGSTGRVLATIRVGGYPDAIAAQNGVVWVALWSRPNVEHHGPPGGVARIAESTGKLLGT
jgi:YVTN family beta-propeller protein